MKAATSTNGAAEPSKESVNRKDPFVAARMKVLQYLFAYLAQWVLPTLMIVSMMASGDVPVITALGLIGVNGGGLLQSIVYFIGG